MAKKAVLTDVSTGHSSTTTLNNNFNALNTALENTLSRDGSTPNVMNADLDMNSNDILNVRSIQVDGVDISTLFAPSALMEVTATFDTVAQMVASTDTYLNQTVATLGYYTKYDGGGAVYKIVNTGTPDNVVDHDLDSGLNAELFHSNVIHAEWAGAVSGREVSAAIQAAWDHLVAWQTAQGTEPRIELVFSATATLANQVTLADVGATREDNANVDFSKSTLTAVSGGNLTSTNAMIVCRIGQGVQKWGRMDGGKFAACLDFFGCAGSKSYDPIVKHFQGFGIRIQGASGSFILTNALSQQWEADDAEFNTQANHTAVGIQVEKGDCVLIAPNAKWCLKPLYIGADVVQLHVIDGHFVNGNPNYPTGPAFVDPIIVESVATRENHLINCYLDNGLVLDYEARLHISGGHFVNNSAATLTEPKIRLYASSAAQTAANDLRIFDLGGLASVGFLDNGSNTWDGDYSGLATEYATMSDENKTVQSIQREYNLFAPSASVVQYNYHPSGDMTYQWTGGASAETLELTFDPYNDLVRIEASELRVRNQDGDNFVTVGGTGGVGIGELQGAGGQLVIRSGDANRWYVTSGGDLIPVTDDAYDIGSTSFRPDWTYLRNVNFTGLPTSASGLNVGDLWVDTGAGNVLKVVV